MAEPDPRDMHVRTSTRATRDDPRQIEQSKSPQGFVKSHSHRNPRFGKKSKLKETVTNEDE